MDVPRSKGGTVIFPSCGTHEIEFIVLALMREMEGRLRSCARMVSNADLSPEKRPGINRGVLRFPKMQTKGERVEQKPYLPQASPAQKAPPCQSGEPYHRANGPSPVRPGPDYSIKSANGEEKHCNDLARSTSGWATVANELASTLLPYQPKGVPVCNPVMWVIVFCLW